MIDRCPSIADFLVDDGGRVGVDHRGTGLGDLTAEQGDEFGEDGGAGHRESCCLKNDWKVVAAVCTLVASVKISVSTVARSEPACSEAYMT